MGGGGSWVQEGCHGWAGLWPLALTARACSLMARLQRSMQAATAALLIAAGPGHRSACAGAGPSTPSSCTKYVRDSSQQHA